MEEVSKIESALTNLQINEVHRNENIADMVNESLRNLERVAHIMIQNTDLKGNIIDHDILNFDRDELRNQLHKIGAISRRIHEEIDGINN